MRFSNYFLIPSSASFDKYKNSVTLLLNNFLFFITFYEIAKILRRISQNYSIISKNKRINKRSKLLLMTSILFFFFHFFFFINNYGTRSRGTGRRLGNNSSFSRGDVVVVCGGEFLLH